MAEIKQNAFAGYIFTSEELQRAANFNVEQRMYIQTVMSDAATEKINLEPMSMNMGHFLQKEAYLRGQMDILAYLLEAVPIQEVGSKGKSPTSEKAVKESQGVDWLSWSQTAAPPKT